jgi:hypothetical protein
MARGRNSIVAKIARLIEAANLFPVGSITGAANQIRTGLSRYGDYALSIWSDIFRPGRHG